jgi:hypothetical protein
MGRESRALIEYLNLIGSKTEQLANVSLMMGQLSLPDGEFISQVSMVPRSHRYVGDIRNIQHKTQRLYSLTLDAVSVFLKKVNPITLNSQPSMQVPQRMHSVFSILLDFTIISTGRLMGQFWVQV